MSFSKVISDFIDIDDAKDFAAGAVESVTGTLDMMNIPRNYLMSQVGIQPPGTYTDAARDALNLQPNTESRAYMAGQIVGGAATGGAGAVRAAGKQGLQYATKEAGKQLGYEGLATAGSEGGAQVGQYLGGDNAEFVGSLAGGVVTGSAGQALGNPNKMDIFAGTRSETIDPMMVDMAVRMERAGEDPERIWNATGMMRGKDGFWRYEISDNQTMFEPFAYKDYKERKLSDALYHPDLYRAYPLIANKRVRTMTPSELKEHQGTTGFYDPRRKEIAIDPRQSPLDQKDTLLHETQHMIQDIEGHSPGGDPETAKQAAAESYFVQKEQLMPEDAPLSYFDAVNRENSMKLSLRARTIELDMLELQNITKVGQLSKSDLWKRHGEAVVGDMPPKPKGGDALLAWEQQAGRLTADAEFNRLQNTVNPFVSGGEQDIYNILYANMGGPSGPRGADQIERVRDELNGTKKALEEHRRLYRTEAMEELSKKHFQRNTRLGPYGMYRYDEGEAEAFNTGERMFMSPSERRASYPPSTMVGAPLFNPDLPFDYSDVYGGADALKDSRIFDGGLERLRRREGIFPED
jgi:hypothetical protein